LLPWGGRVQGQASNTQEITRPLTIGDNLPVMFRRGDGHHDGWILKLKAPDQTIAVVGPPDSTGWSLNVGGSGNTVTISETCAERNYAKFTWFGSPDGEALFHTRIEGTIRPCPGPGGGGGGGGQPPPFNIEIIDGLVFLVERESETVIGGFVRIAAYRREGNHYGDEDRIPVEVTWSCLDGNLVFHEVLTDAEGKKTPGNPLASDNRRQHEVFVTSAIEKTYEVIAAVDPGDNGYGDNVPGYNLKAYVTFHDISLAVDMNRDGKITPVDRVLNSATNPWRFWYNDDRDFTGPDAVSEFNEPGQSKDENDFFKYLNGSVNVPVRDLLDYYPLLIHVGNHIRATAPDGLPKFRYRLYVTSGLGMLESRVLFTKLEALTSGAYLSDVAVAEEIGRIQVNPSYTMENNLKIGAFGMHLDHRNITYNHPGKEFLENLLLGSPSDTNADETILQDGIFLVQHGWSGTGQPPPVLNAEIRLEVWGINDNNRYDDLTFTLPIRISSVENMFMHIDLIGVTRDSYTPQNRHLWQDPPNYPDELTNDTRFIYVHGYNNNMQASRGSNAENFKRLHMLGSRAKYIAVSWYGWQSQIQWDPFVNNIGFRTPDFQINMINAFHTAEMFANFLRHQQWQKNKTVVAAHSLGNMLVSSAIEDWTNRDDQGVPTERLVDNYIMINAAVSQEAYGLGNRVDRDMVYRSWGQLINDNPNNPINPQHSKLFAFNWNLLFQQTEDSRQYLTWNNRFGNVSVFTDKHTNIWSMGDRTFFPHPHENMVISEPLSAIMIGLQTFARQEKNKGLGGVQNDQVGGYGRNPHYDVVAIPGGGVYHAVPIEYITNPETIPENYLKMNPLFRADNPGLSNKHGPWAQQIYQQMFVQEFNMNIFENRFRDRLLSVMIPSKLGGMGRAGPDFIPSGFTGMNNIEMQNAFSDQNIWPVPEFRGGYWDHGHFQTIALPYVSKLYAWIRDQLN